MLGVTGTTETAGECDGRGRRGQDGYEEAAQVGLGAEVLAAGMSRGPEWGSGRGGDPLGSVCLGDWSGKTR